MTRHLIVPVLSLATVVLAETPRRPGTGIDKIPTGAGTPVADVTNDERLNELRTRALENQPAPKPEPPRASSFSLKEMSTIVQGDTHFVLLPKGSILWCPPALEKKITDRPSGTATDWLTFFAENRSWITKHEVTRDQITGKAPIAEATAEHFRKRGMLVVATLEGGPVTVISRQP